jgi:2-polyprenyl-3-methyl-5-hydroxy-6-metoxy-1,4-benzoquinol methylase
MRWNHNIHYHPLIHLALPAGGHVLDVGCGEGTLARELAVRAERVTGIDADAASIALARATASTPNVDYLHADVMQHAFAPASFDALVSVATLHHIGAARGLARFNELLKPGGTLVVVGLAASEWPRDLGRELAAVVATRWLQWRRGYWEHSAPTVWPPPETYRDVSAIAAKELPGACYRRHALWRYSLVWRKPN